MKLQNSEKSSCKWTRGLIPAVFLFSVLQIPAQFALGQEADPASESDSDLASLMEEVVVTAQRREQLLVDVPIAVSVFSAEEIVASDFRDVTDFFQQVPNVVFGERGSRYDRDLTIRGLTNVGGVPNAVGFFLDGVSVARVTTNPEIMDIEQIEVLRGPQTTYFGRATPGGSVNVVTRKPQSEFDYGATARIGSFSTYGVSGVINAPISERFFVRASGYFETTDGYMENIHPVGGDSGGDNTALRLSGRWLPTEDVTVDLMLMYEKESLHIRSGVPSGVLHPFTFFRLGIRQPIEDGVGFYPENLDQVNHDVRSHSKNELGLVIGTVLWAINDNLDFKSITAFGERKLNRLVDSDRTSFDMSVSEADVEWTTKSQEFHLLGKAGEKVDWFLGVGWSEDQEGPVVDITTHGADSTLIGQWGGPPFLGYEKIEVGDQEIVRVSETREIWSIFGELTWYINDQWWLTAGGRYTDESEEQVGVVSSDFGPSQDIGGVSKPVSNFSPRFAVHFNATENVNLYGVVATAIKPGIVANDGTVLDDEKFTNFELGAKGTGMDGRIRYGAAAFYTKWDDLQVVTGEFNPGAGPPILSTRGNAADATAKGIELELDFLATENLFFRAAFGYLKAKYGDFPDAVVSGEIVDLSGQTFARAPKYTGSLVGQYDWRFSKDWEGFVRAEWNYRDKFLSSPDDYVAACGSESFPCSNPDQVPFVVPSYDVINLRAGFGRDRYRFEAYVTNLLDDDYYSASWGNSFPGGVALALNPRQYGLRFILQTTR